tara:strand:+ start:33250 stop:33468 length:219 start_codon:yes stop_codon:yes gene_type:complete
MDFTNNPYNSYPILNKIIKEQNKYLLNYIATYLNLNEDQKKELFEDFWKVSYYSPKITGSKKIEKIQGHMIR